MTAPRATPPEHRLVRLRDDHVEVVVLPDQGADVYSFVDRGTGVDVLFRTPWGWRDPARLPGSGLDERDFIARYHGGWQLLVPNAGPAREIDGVVRGYHGEAAVVPWTVVDRSPSEVTLATTLTTAPLDLTRRLTLADGRLRIDTTVHNTSPDDVAVGWVEHPAFGPPFVDEHATLSTGAGAVLSDADDPGTLLAADTWSAPDAARTHGGGAVSLARLPGPERRKTFAALADFDRGWYRITSPSVGFAIEVEWDTTTLPYAWFWQEWGSSPGFPWFRRAFAVAVEPANILPGHGPAGRSGTHAPLSRGHLPVLAGGSSWQTSMSMTRSALAAGQNRPGPVSELPG